MAKSSKASLGAERPDVRHSILVAAWRLIDEQGMDALTQPRIAAAAGIRQSHLTYYFPRRSDLLAALLVHSHEHAEGHDLFAGLVHLIFDANRARFLVAVIDGTSGDAANRAVVAAHLDGFTRHMAASFGRKEGDPAIVAFVSQLRGMMLENLVAPEPDPARRIAEAAHRLGLSPLPDRSRLL